jgi:rRNA small subunit pseudouridine methyltransferase Nep1
VAGGIDHVVKTAIIYRSKFSHTHLVASVALVIAEASLETVPKQIARHVSVMRHAERLGKKPTEILLDRSYHHSAMVTGKLESVWKRGRPDIVHFALQEALSTPLYLENKLSVYIYTINSKVILIGANLRIPKSYFRFEGLMMKLFKDKIIKSQQDNRILLELLDDVTFEHLIKNIARSSKSIGLSSGGVASTAEEVVSKYIDGIDHCQCTIVIGGFPKGHFSDDISNFLDNSYSIGKTKLEAHVVIARVLYECEKKMSIA